MRGLSTEMLIYIPCEDHSLATVTLPGQKLLRFPSGRKKKVGERSYFATFSMSFLWQVVTLGPGV